MTKRFTVSIISAISVLVCLVFTGFRIGFVFVDHEVFNGFCYLLWGVFILGSVLLLFQLRSSLTDRKHFCKPLYGVLTGITALSVVCMIAFLIIGGSNEFLNYVYASRETLPYLAAFYCLIFFAFVFPICTEKFRKIAAVAVAAVIVFSCISFLFPLGGFSFESVPAVFDDGDSYKVVFAANRKSLGYVQYEFNGESVTLWDRFTGRKEAQTVHSIDVPYEALANNSYTVGAVRVYEDLAYGGHTGKTITQTVERFTPCAADDFDMLCITDNHGCRIDWTSVKNDFDIGVFLGDYANAIYSEECMVDNLLIPAATVSGGSKPMIYVRGNHGNRGGYVKTVLDELGYNRLYYRINAGEYVFTVLDTGEDKADDNYEYAGFSDYDAYFKDELAWLESLEKTPGYQIALAHCPDGFKHAEQLNGQLSEHLKRLGVDFIVGGDYHRTEYVPQADSATGIPYYICGAKNGMSDLRYTMMHMNAGEVKIASYDLGGALTMEASHTLTRTEA